jgi:hypothetical protein
MATEHGMLALTETNATLGGKYATWKSYGLWLAGFALLAMGTAMWRMSELYDLWLATATAESKTQDFYPDIFILLFAAFVCALLAYAITVFWNRIPNWMRLKRLGAVMALIIVSVVFGALGTWKFYDPRPLIVISDDFLSCGPLRARWGDIADINPRIVGGRRGGSSRFADLKLVPGTSKGNSTGSCGLDDLNKDSATVYEAIHDAWQSALRKPSRALQNKRM